MLAVDCRSVQEVACGYSPIDSVRGIATLLDEGWAPWRSWDDSVAWFPRDQKVIADHLANFAMGHTLSWTMA